MEATVPYEESGWYDGQIWIKPPEILLQDRYDSDDNTCSLRESKCKNGERIDNRITKIYENIEKMKYYENSITNNTLIDCHKFDDVYFLNDYNYFKEMIIFLSKKSI